MSADVPDQLSFIIHGSAAVAVESGGKLLRTFAVTALSELLFWKFRTQVP